VVKLKIFGLEFDDGYLYPDDPLYKQIQEQTFGCIDDILRLLEKPGSLAAQLKARLELVVCRDQPESRSFSRLDKIQIDLGHYQECPYSVVAEEAMHYVDINLHPDPEKKVEYTNGIVLGFEILGKLYANYHAGIKGEEFRLYDNDLQKAKENVIVWYDKSTAAINRAVDYLQDFSRQIAGALKSGDTSVIKSGLSGAYLTALPDMKSHFRRVRRGIDRLVEEYKGYQWGAYSRELESKPLGFYRKFSKLFVNTYDDIFVGEPVDELCSWRENYGAALENRDAAEEHDSQYTADKLYIKNKTAVEEIIAGLFDLPFSSRVEKAKGYER